jgi:hypothetical protein
MHIHNPPSNIFNLTPLFLFLYLRHGIVRIREAGDTDGTGTPAAVALIESGAVPGIDLHYSYAFVQTGRARWTNSIHYDHPGQAEEIIRRLRHLGARWVKSYENLDVERVTALIAAARREGLGVLGHVRRSRHSRPRAFRERNAGSWRAWTLRESWVWTIPATSKRASELTS